MIQRIDWSPNGGDGAPPRPSHAGRLVRIDEVTVSLDAPPRVADGEVEFDLLIETVMSEADGAA